MKTSAYFTISVVTSLAVPVVLGGFMFLGAYQKESSSTYVQNTKESAEIVILGNTEIENFNPENFSESEYTNGNFIEFEVSYPDGEVPYSGFNLSIIGIEFSPNVLPEDVAWKLEHYDSDKDTYRIINSGTFGSDEKIKIASSEIVKLKNSQKYRLYYYVKSEASKYNRGTMKAKVILG